MAIPKVGERCHQFGIDEPHQVILDVVLAASFKLGFSLPMHPFFLEVLGYFDLALIQLTSNSYRMSACIYVLYSEQLKPQLSPRKLCYLYELKDVVGSSGYSTLRLEIIGHANASRETKCDV